MTLTKDRLETALAPRTVRYFERVGSTNDIALAWLQAGADTGSVVVADEQIRGRGRQGHVWHTPPGVALAVSVILHPPPDSLPRISMLGALAIAEVCEHLGLNAIGIKWPNDVQVNGRKISGVLPEAVWDGEQLTGVVLGMGVNVRTDFSGTGLENLATSIEAELGQPVDRTEILVKLLARVDDWAQRLGTIDLLAAWKTRLTTLGQPIQRKTEKGTVSGFAESVDEIGALLVRQADGTLSRIVAGDIELSSD